jgi:hypothetical protein
VPLASLDPGALAEDLIDGLSKPLAPVDDAENPLLEGKSTSDKVARQLHNEFGPLGRPLRKAQNLLARLIPKMRQTLLRLRRLCERR